MSLFYKRGYMIRYYRQVLGENYLFRQIKGIDGPATAWVYFRSPEGLYEPLPICFTVFTNDDLKIVPMIDWKIGSDKHLESAQAEFYKHSIRERFLREEFVVHYFDSYGVEVSQEVACLDEEI
jgi:hypothetical protein